MASDVNQSAAVVSPKLRDRMKANLETYAEDIGINTEGMIVNAVVVYDAEKDVQRVRFEIVADVR